MMIQKPTARKLEKIAGDFFNSVLGGSVRRIGLVERAILEEMTVGDILIGSLQSARSVKLMHKKAYERARDRYMRKRALASLERGGYITPSSSEGASSLTALGRFAVLAGSDRLRTKYKDEPWDGKWRLVSFDIPQNFRGVRTALRRLLLRSGFKKAQGSVYLFPHHCKELMDFFMSDPRLFKHILLVVAPEISDADRWKREFGLT